MNIIFKVPDMMRQGSQSSCGIQPVSSVLTNLFLRFCEVMDPVVKNISASLDLVCNHLQPIV